MAPRVKASACVDPLSIINTGLPESLTCRILSSRLLRKAPAKNSKQPAKLEATCAEKHPSGDKVLGFTG